MRIRSSVRYLAHYTGRLPPPSLADPPAPLSYKSVAGIASVLLLYTHCFGGSASLSLSLCLSPLPAQASFQVLEEVDNAPFNVEALKALSLTERCLGVPHRAIRRQALGARLRAYGDAIRNFQEKPGWQLARCQNAFHRRPATERDGDGDADDTQRPPGYRPWPLGADTVTL